MTIQLSCRQPCSDAVDHGWHEITTFCRDAIHERVLQDFSYQTARIPFVFLT